MDTNAPAPKPDMIEHAGKLIKRLNGMSYVSDHLVANNENTVALATAVLAVAAELRDIHNVLHEINVELADQERAAVNQLREEIGSLRVAQGHLATILGQVLKREKTEVAA